MFGILDFESLYLCRNYAAIFFLHNIIHNRTHCPDILAKLYFRIILSYPQINVRIILFKSVLKHTEEIKFQI